MGALHNGETSFPLRRPELPAFCRTRRPTLSVPISNLKTLRRLLWLVLVLQVSTMALLLVAALASRSSACSSIAAPGAGSIDAGIASSTVSSKITRCWSEP